MAIRSSSSPTSDLLRIPESADAIGVEKQFKIVTCGESVDAVTPVDFTTWGLSYLRPCPSTVISASLIEPPETPADGDSYLLPNDTSLSGVWADHGGQIATWSDETDNWVYCTPAPGTIIHIEGEDRLRSRRGCHQRRWRRHHARALDACDPAARRGHRRSGRYRLPGHLHAGRLSQGSVVRGGWR